MFFVYRFFCGFDFIGCAPVLTGKPEERRQFRDFFRTLSDRPEFVWGMKELIYPDGECQKRAGVSAN